MTDEMTPAPLVRCVRCHVVFEPGLENCPRCGTTYRPIPVAPAPEIGSYAEKYHGTEFAPAVIETTAPVVPHTGPRIGIVVALGAAMVIIALAVGGLYAMGAFGGPAATQQALVFANTPRPTPSPTLPPSVSVTLNELRDMNLSAHIKIQTRATMDASVNGTAASVIANMDVTVSGGNESGTLTIGGAKKEFRLVDGIYYDRLAPAVKWTIRSVIPPVMLLTPLFQITDAKMLELVGAETRDGVAVNHFQTTGWWVPDQSRMSLFDVSSMAIRANKTVLDLWATPDGKPVAGAFSATQDTSDGSVHLLNIQVSYAFDQVGVPVTINNPMPSPSPSASHS